MNELNRSGLTLTLYYPKKAVPNTLASELAESLGLTPVSTNVSDGSWEKNHGGTYTWLEVFKTPSQQAAHDIMTVQLTLTHDKTHPKSAWPELGKHLSEIAQEHILYPETLIGHTLIYHGWIEGEQDHLALLEVVKNCAQETKPLEPVEEAPRLPLAFQKDDEQLIALMRSPHNTIATPKDVAELWQAHGTVYILLSPITQGNQDTRREALTRRIRATEDAQLILAGLSPAQIRMGAARV